MKKRMIWTLILVIVLLAIAGRVLSASKQVGETDPVAMREDVNAQVEQAAAGVIYYVDFDGGDDANDGLSKDTAWKHAPGDDNATGNANAVTLQPGDTVLFKGGVVYRGKIYLLRFNGTVTAPITYKGNGWGEERAIIEGSQIITTPWTQCESRAACGGNSNWQNIYYTDAPAGVDFTQGFFEDDAFVWQAQDPNPGDPFYYDQTDYFRVIPHDDPTVTQTQTSITDPNYFTQTETTAWDGASVLAWRIPNVTVIRKVTGFDPDTSTIYHEDLDGDIYTDRDTYYAVLNHLRLLDQPGEYVLDEAAGRFFVWPSDSGHPSQHTPTRSSIITLAFLASSATTWLSRGSRSLSSVWASGPSLTRALPATSPSAITALAYCGPTMDTPYRSTAMIYWSITTRWSIANGRWALWQEETASLFAITLSAGPPGRVSGSWGSRMARF